VRKRNMSIGDEEIEEMRRSERIEKKIENSKCK
jgi:hypothetical protein